MALLLLRSVLGFAVLQQGALGINEPDATAFARALALTALVSGVFLLVGFLTPIAGAVVAGGGAATALGWIPAFGPDLFDSTLLILFAAAILLAILILGPGAISVDARLFGRREIIIPPSSSQSSDEM